MVEFLQEINGKDFTFEKGKRYVSMIYDKSDLENKILVRQPNSSEKISWWASFSKDMVGVLFRIVSNEEKSFQEKIEENKVLAGD